MDRPVHAGVVDAVGRIGREQRGLLAGHQARDVLGLRRVAAEEPVVAEHPEVARLRDGIDRRRLGPVVLDVAAAPGRPISAIRSSISAGGEPDAVERVQARQLAEELRQDGLVPFGELSRSGSARCRAPCTSGRRRRARRRRTPSSRAASWP